MTSLLFGDGVDVLNPFPGDGWEFFGAVEGSWGLQEVDTLARVRVEVGVVHGLDLELNPRTEGRRCSLEIYQVEIDLLQLGVRYGDVRGPKVYRSC